MEIKITFLGTGGSSGVPTIGCECKICTSNIPQNIRTRTSICISYNDTNVLVDTSTDFRLQMLANKITSLDAILFTHCHADHIVGLTDIRPINWMQKGPIPSYGSRETLREIRKTFSYIFNAPEELKQYFPQVDMHEIDGVFSIDGIEFLPLTVKHHKMDVTAFRFGKAAYLTDLNFIPEENFSLLEGLDVLILDAFSNHTHISHFSLEEALEAADRIGAKQTYFTHCGHDFDYEETNRKLPDSIQLAYDGLVVTV